MTDSDIKIFSDQELEIRNKEVTLKEEEIKNNVSV